MSGHGRIGAARALLGSGAGLLALLAGCASPPAPAAAPVPPPPRVAPPAPPRPPSPPSPTEWSLLPLTPGDWTYTSDAAGSRAAFGLDPAAPAFVVSCDAQRREVSLSRPSAGGGALVVRTSYGVRSLGAPRLVASDSLLDEIAFSRGRFTVEGAGLPTLVVPAWAEPARVVEDCRG